MRLRRPRHGGQGESAGEDPLFPPEGGGCPDATPLSRDAAGHGTDGGGRAAGGEDGAAAGAATVATGPFRRVSPEDAWSLLILSGLRKFTEGVFAKRF